jgi:O-antigen ligase
LHPGFLKTQTNLGQGYDNAYFNKVSFGTSDRSQMARDSVNYVLKYPLGIGGGNSARVLPEQYHSQWGKGTPGPHNIFLGFFVELGVWGGLYFAVFILWLLYRLFNLNDLKNKKKFVLTPEIISRVSVFGALLGFMVYHQFVDSYAITPNVFYFWILLAMASHNFEVDAK